MVARRTGRIGQVSAARAAPTNVSALLRLVWSAMRRPLTLAIVMVAAALLAWSPTAGAAPATPPPATTAAEVPSGWGSFPSSTPHPKSDIVVDAQDGRVLFGDNIHDALHPASTL